MSDFSSIINGAFGAPGGTAVPPVTEAPKKPKKERPKLSPFTAAKAQNVYKNPIEQGSPNAPPPPPQKGGTTSAMGTAGSWGSPK